VSLLLDHGHPEARLYPLGMLWDESNLVIERVNGRIVTEASLLQFAVNSILCKKSRTEFSKMIQSLNVETRPFDIDDPFKER
jgi:hypothetical protein